MLQQHFRYGVKIERERTWKIVDPMQCETRHDCVVRVLFEMRRQLFFIEMYPFDRDCQEDTSQLTITRRECEPHLPSNSTS